jgi:hypothetical protein
MSQIAIDSNIPIPNGKFGDLPFEDMNPGDSFMFPNDIKPTSASHYVSIANKKLAPKKFILRTVADGKRAWRIDEEIDIVPE